MNEFPRCDLRRNDAGRFSFSLFSRFDDFADGVVFINPTQQHKYYL